MPLAAALCSAALAATGRAAPPQPSRAPERPPTLPQRPRTPPRRSPPARPPSRSAISRRPRRTSRRRLAADPQSAAAAYYLGYTHYKIGEPSKRHERRTRRRPRSSSPRPSRSTRRSPPTGAARRPPPPPTAQAVSGVRRPLLQQALDEGHLADVRVEHEPDQQEDHRRARVHDPALDERAHVAPRHALDRQDREVAAVERGEREQVQDPDLQADHRDQEQQRAGRRRARRRPRPARSRADPSSSSARCARSPGARPRRRSAASCPRSSAAPRRRRRAGPNCFDHRLRADPDARSRARVLRSDR